MKTRIGVAALCAMTLGGALGAQDRQTFRTATRLVEVSVVVTDGAGNPIRGLTRKDFTVTEAGAPQEITFFEVLDESRAMPPTIEAHGRPDRPSDFSNAVPRNVRTMTVILLDRTNAAFASQWYAHKHAERYLRQKDARDRVALYVWDGAVRVLHDFTDDAASLLEALETYRSRVSGEYEASEEPPSDTGDIAAWIVDPGLSMSEFFQERRAFSTLEAFEMLAAHLKRIAGRKQIVWLSEAFAIPARFGRQEFLLRLRRATNALSDAQASLYPVDARGLVGAIRYTRGVPSFTSMATIKPNNDTMEIIAEETGARAFANTNDLAASIRRAVDDSRVTYVLGYYAPNAADGKFRRIDVDVKGRKVIVRHRSGYFAEPPPSRAEFARESAVRQALEAPLQATAITLTADAVRTQDSNQVVLTLRIDAEALSFERRGDRWLAAVDVMFAQVDRGGRGRVSANVPMTIAWTDAERAAALAKGIAVNQRVTLDERAHQVRIVVRDVASGKVGSLVVLVRSIRTTAGRAPGK